MINKVAAEFADQAHHEKNHSCECDEFEKNSDKQAELEQQIL